MECHILFPGHCDFDLWFSLREIVSAAHLILFDAGFPNLVCGYILSLLSHIVSRSFDLDLWPQFSKNCVNSISLYLVCGNILGSQCHILFLGHCELDFC